MKHIEYIEKLKDAPDPIAAQVAFEKRVRAEDFVAHLIAVLLVIGFFVLALTALLGLVDLTQPVIATLIGTTLGYAVGKLSPVLERYFLARIDGERTAPDERKSP